MDKQKTLELLKAAGLIAVIRGSSAELTIQMVSALVAGGVYGIEITYSTPNAAEVTRILSSQYGSQIILGMGTLVHPEQAEEARSAGAQFLVSPICEPVLGRAMIDSGLTTMIGAFTPTEVFQAYEMGSDVVKVFPGSVGGPAYLKALKGPFPYIPMMPTGGVSISNIAEWFDAGALAIGAGSELCPTSLAKEGRFDEITRRAQEFVSVVENCLDKQDGAHDRVISNPSLSDCH
jgi:2-dehydro-3-deoxyphosphogluconate aldolase/(4S)-4-hydroxy-2-oxoglutarate aldolase